MGSLAGQPRLFAEIQASEGSYLKNEMEGS